MEKAGFYPYTRGIHPEMYRRRLWTMRQYAGFGSAKETNQRFRYLLSHGQTGLSTAFDLPTQLGFDSDAPEAKSEVGKVGVAVSSLADMESVLNRIPLDEVSLSMTINAPAAILWAMVLAIADKRKIPWKKLRGTIQNDILKEYLARGTYIFPPKPSLKLTVDAIEFAVGNVPNWNPISVSGYHIREAGSTAAQELALTLAHGETYIKESLKRGLHIDQFAEKFSFFFAVGNHFFEEIAKFRTARKLWAELVRKKFKAKKETSEKLRFHAQTSGATLTAQQPENNLVRVAYQAMAAVLGGAQSLHTNSMDEALSLPSEEGALLALRTQQIIASESGIPSVADPLGGSEHLEALNQKLVRETRRILNRIKHAGGVIPSLESGFSRKMIEKSFLASQNDLENKKRYVVGVNIFENRKETLSISRFQSGLKPERDQIKKLQSFKLKRNQLKIRSYLDKLERAASNDENLMPLFIELVKQKVTVGEICSVLRKVYGEAET